MLTGLAGECCATYSLAKYDDLRDNIHCASLANLNPQFSGGLPAWLDSTDIYAAQVVTIVFCVLVATVYGTDFFFLLFFPGRRYPGWYHAAKLVVASIVTLGMAAAAIMSTIVISAGSAIVTGGSTSEIASLIDRFSHPPLLYRSWDVNIAWLVLLWIAFISTVASTMIMYIATKHDRQHGPEPYPRDGSLTHGDSKFTAPPKAHFSEKHRGRPSTTTDGDSFDTPARTSVSTRPGSTVEGGLPHHGGVRSDKVGMV
ncbi:hypothetical protein BKA70DRAFT_1115523 [Coprinopsis sp. MPI-PUGE-AT-0042]|nr:hypothetical protein BKA70DRAFT_1115523 [Coprinopsis sp. MPI-PUGE-AT-0042]